MKDLFNFNTDLLNIKLMESNKKDFVELEKTTYIEKFNSYDHLNIKELDFILWFFKTNKYFENQDLMEKGSSMLDHLISYLDIEIEDSIEVNVSKEEILLKKFQSYGYKNQDKIGRFYSKTSSIQYWEKDLRFLLLKDSYFDIDLVSSHLSILLSYAQRKSFDHKLEFLPKFIKNKVEYQLLMFKTFLEHPGLENTTMEKFYPAAEAKFKELLLVYSNKDLPNSFVNPGGLQGKFLTHIEALQRDLKIIRIYLNKDYSLLRLHNAVSERLKNISKEKKEKKNYFISLQNFYCYSVENEIIYSIFEYTNKLGLDIVPMFDGALITYKNLSEENITSLLKDLNTVIKKKFPSCFLVRKNIGATNEFLADLDVKFLSSKFKYYNELIQLDLDLLKSKIENYYESNKVEKPLNIYEEVDDYFQLLLIKEFKELKSLYNWEKINSLILEFENKYLE